MNLYQDTRPHPLGIVANPEWQQSETRRAELYLAERARRENPEREPNRFHIALAIIGFGMVVVCLLAGVLS